MLHHLVPRITTVSDVVAAERGGLISVLTGITSPKNGDDMAGQSGETITIQIDIISPTKLVISWHVGT